MRIKPSQALYYLLLAVFILLGAVLGTNQLMAGAVDRALLGYASVLFLAVAPLVKALVGRHPYRAYCVLFAFCIMAYDIGCVYQGFDGYPYFDKVSHFISGMVFTAFGFCVFMYLDRSGPQHRKRWVLACTYALFFSLFVAVVWEIGEFTGYLLTGHDSQHHLDTGVFDTMEDIISCFVGSLISVGSYLLYGIFRIRLLTGAVVEEFGGIVTGKQ